MVGLRVGIGARGIDKAKSPGTAIRKTLVPALLPFPGRLHALLEFLYAGTT